MQNTQFINPHGWHNDKQYTTAYDMAKLAISLRKRHPQYYKMFANKKFTFKGKTIQTYNKVLLKHNDADGLKTGFTNASGFNLVTSVKNKKTNIVAVVMGSNSAAERDQKMLNLIDKFSHKASQYILLPHTDIQSYYHFQSFFWCRAAMVLKVGMKDEILQISLNQLI